MYGSFKKNPASQKVTIINEETGEEKERYVNKMRWKGGGLISIMFSEPKVSSQHDVHHFNINGV